MPKTSKPNPGPRHCQIKPVNPGFRSMSIPRCSNDLGKTGWVNPAAAEEALGAPEQCSEWIAANLQNRIRKELDPTAWARLQSVAERRGMSVDELLRSTLEVLA